MVQALPQTDRGLAILAVDLIRQAGCEYGDIRICHYRRQSLMAREIAP